MWSLPHKPLGSAPHTRCPPRLSSSPTSWNSSPFPGPAGGSPLARGPAMKGVTMTLNRLAPTLLLGALFFLPATVSAQTDGADNPECLGDQCGRPKEEGGGCGCGCGCSVWVAYTDDGKTLSYTDDGDGDGKADDKDNCPFTP